MSLIVGDKVQVRVEKIVFGGQGLARHHSQVIFIPFSAPGDHLSVQIERIEKNYVQGKILDVLEAGPGRRAPPCKYFYKCGGCNLQHLTTTAQLEQKESILYDNLTRLFANKLGLTDAVKTALKPIIPSPRDFRYRNRIQPNFKDHRLGFYLRDSHQLVSLDDCLIAEEALGESLLPLLNELNEKGAEPGRYEIMLNENLTTEFTRMGDEPEGFGFSQVNRFQNLQLIEFVLSALSPALGSRIYDLYSGSGNFTFAIMEKFKNPLTAVELSQKLVAKLKNRLQEHPRRNQLQSYCADVELFLKRTEFRGTDVVVLDPPRMGCSDFTVRSLASAGVHQIIYISCDPASLARDLARFFAYASKAGHRYQIHTIQPFEMFPQTDHLETILDLRLDLRIDSPTKGS